ncbi:protein kinase domain containing protein [Entamoeba nuttalli P19]|uniref:Protein kinase domain containing protein n=1 Tax=Entamoeba nuttalli (strain P19) TaxID=1076696 RepID=K2H3S6_ENTNP|nr:protein kinase domain containing protein [Entamoeba nuttalli P19]EKE37094.1 protein kinase domain containing protein [Entamoeba nuttalli P19]|eukprot:XP_008860572.1 protein kinase domain containing protein [Entamoeba nuttalli P19]
MQESSTCQVSIVPSCLTFNRKSSKEQNLSQSTDCPVHEILEEEVVFTNEALESYQIVINGFAKINNYWISCSETSFILLARGIHKVTFYAMIRNSSGEIKSEIPIHVFGTNKGSTNYKRFWIQQISVVLLPQLSQYLSFDECKLSDRIYTGEYNAIFKGTYRSLDVAISKVKSRNERIETLQKMKEEKERNHEKLSDINQSELNQFLKEKEEGIPEDFSRSPFVLEIREIAKIQRNLISPYILTFVGLTEFPYAAITELAPYGDAESFYEKHQLTQTLKFKIFEDIANGVAACHRFDIMHLDLKPSNIFIFSLNPLDSVVAKLADFGAAKRINFDNVPSNVNFTSTKLYTAPEMLKFITAKTYKGKKRIEFLKSFNLEDLTPYTYIEADLKKEFGNNASQVKAERDRNYEFKLYQLLHVGLTVDIFCYSLTIFEIFIERSLIYTEEVSKASGLTGMDKFQKILTADLKTSKNPTTTQKLLSLRGFPLTLTKLKAPKWFRDILDKTWAIDPTQRISMTEVARRFHKYISLYLNQFKTRNDETLSVLKEMRSKEIEYFDTIEEIKLSTSNVSLEERKKNIDSKYFTEIKKLKSKLIEINDNHNQIKQSSSSDEMINPEGLIDITSEYSDYTEMITHNNLVGHAKIYGLSKTRTPEEIYQYKRNNFRIRYDYEISWGSQPDQILELKEKDKYGKFVEEFKKEDSLKKEKLNTQIDSYFDQNVSSNSYTLNDSIGYSKKQVLSTFILDEDGEPIFHLSNDEHPKQYSNEITKKVVKKTTSINDKENSTTTKKTNKKKVVKKTTCFDEDEIGLDETQKIIDLNKDKKEPTKPQTTKTCKKKVIKKTICLDDEETDNLNEEKQDEHIKQTKKKIIKKTINFNDEENVITENTKTQNLTKKTKKKIIKKTISLDE